MTHRQVIEEAGFEALQRLDDIALRDAGPCRPVACFLPGLSSGLRFPFDLTDLRRLDDALFEDCMAVPRMDARVTAREVHTYFADGGVKFEQLAQLWSVQDMEKVRVDAERAAQPEGLPAPAA